MSLVGGDHSSPPKRPITARTEGTESRAAMLWPAPRTSFFARTQQQCCSLMERGTLGPCTGKKSGASNGLYRRNT